MPDRPQGQALMAAADAAQSCYLTRLATLVGIDSGTADVDGVNRMAEQVARYARKAGMDPQLVPVGDGRHALVARRTGHGAVRIMLSAHLDTVFPQGTAAERPFRIDDRGHARGPGVCDDKGGLLAGLAATEVLIALGAESYREIVLVCSPDEETGSVAGSAVFEQVAADVALCLEGARANGDIVSSRKGVTDVEVLLHGRAAHAGIEPEKGANAALAAARLTESFQGLNGRWPDVTVIVGLLSAGSAPNVVAEDARLVADVRAARTTTFDEVIAEIRRLAGEHRVEGVTAEVALHAPMPPWERDEQTAHLAGLAAEVGRRVGVEVRDTATGGAADANLIAATGTAVLDGLGPVGGGDHSPDEWLEVSSVVPRIALLAGLIDEVAQA